MIFVHNTENNTHNVCLPFQCMWQCISLQTHTTAWKDRPAWVGSISLLIKGVKNGHCCVVCPDKSLVLSVMHPMVWNQILTALVLMVAYLAPRVRGYLLAFDLSQHARVTSIWSGTDCTGYI